MAYIGKNNFREEELNPRLEYTMIILDNLQRTCTVWVIGDRKVLRTRCSDEPAELI